MQDARKSTLLLYQLQNRCFNEINTIAVKKRLIRFGNDLIDGTSFVFYIPLEIFIYVSL